MINSLDVAEIKNVRELVHSALAGQCDELSRKALSASLKTLDALAETSSRNPLRHYAGTADFTFHDEECAPYGREIDVRIHYSWSDYNRTDQPSSHWGANVKEVELVAVRYFDQHGDVTTLGAHHRDLAQDLLSAHDQRLHEVCTDDGCRKGVGEYPVWYIPSKVSAVEPTATAIPARMAPSQSTRAAEETRRRLG
jgi:hypothetical protein